MGADAVKEVRARAYTVPTDAPEADGTFRWTSTTIVVVEVVAGPLRGIGYTYGPKACAHIIDELLAPVVLELGSPAPEAAFEAMVRALRNAGRPGMGSMAISALDCALWDLAGKAAGCSVLELLGSWHDAVPAYGSGGFTSYDEHRLLEQLTTWAREGLRAVKMKIGTNWGSEEAADRDRIAAVRAALPDATALFVDANGAYERKQALRLARRFEDEGVTWFEEPVSSDDLDGLAAIAAQTSMDVAAGEYGYDLASLTRLAQSVDCLQADVTRCGGITEWRRVADAAAALGLDVSAHCAPSLHVQVACATQRCRHVEYFHDHVRIEHLLFDGAVSHHDGKLVAPSGCLGLGLELKDVDAEPFRVG